MGEKLWTFRFKTGQDRLRIHFVTRYGRVISIIVIQYEAYIDGKWRAIVRFDEAHGFFHRDVMSPFGKQKKTAYVVEDKNKALSDAIDHIKQDWMLYRQAYEDKYYE